MVGRPAERFGERRERLRDLVRAELAAEHLAITDLPSIRYLTGFTGSNAALVVSRDGPTTFGTDGRYRDQVAEQAPDLTPVIDRDTLMATLRVAPGGALAVEPSLTIGDVQRVRAEFGEVEVADDLVARLRAVKDPDELALIARACAITAEALTVLAGEIRVGMTEVRLARRLEQLFGELGAEDRAFDTIVATGPHSAIPHHEPVDRRLEPGDLLVVDCGARYAGYHADLTRTFVVGRDPEPWQAEIHAIVLMAQERAALRFVPGSDARGTYETARAVIADAGYADAFSHGLGHGVGLQIHEAPMVGPRSTGSLESGMAVTDEPGIYLPGRGGVRIEDTLVVSGTGPSILTEAPRDLVVVG